MAINIIFNTKEFDNGIENLKQKVLLQNRKALREIGNEILRLSTFEVPHDKGLLQASGHLEMGKEEALVGYNKVYAARLHENPQFRFQKGRKGKYLEDPIKNNLGTFRRFYSEILGEII